MVKAAAKHPLVAFFVLAYGISWLLEIPLFFGAPFPIFIPAVTLGPTVAALAVHRLATGNFKAFRIADTLPRTLATTALGVALILVVFVVLPAIATTDPRKLNWSILLSLGVFNYSTLLGGPLFEEPGWRGFALPRLEARFGPLRASILLGVLWTGWHLPLFLLPGWTSSPLWIYTLILIGLSLIISFCVNLGGFNVITAIAMHAMFNTVSRYLGGLFVNVQPSEALPFELVMAACGLGAALVLVIATKGRLA